MCGEPIGAEHGHVADIVDRRLRCLCRGCYLLFAPEGAGGARLRTIPQRYVRLHPSTVSEAVWQSMGIPVDLVFFFRQTTPGAEPALLAYYPSPAGATESLLALDGWAAITRANPELAGMQDDVEAVLLRRRPDGDEIYLVPIDACYRLVGVVRRSWAGFGGGDDLRAAVDAYFADLARRSVRPEQGAR